MLRGEGNGLAQVIQRAGDVLPGQGKHHIQVDAGKARLPREGNGAHRFGTAVDAPQRPQLRIGKALHADGEAVHACCAVSGEFFLLEGAGIGFQGDFAIGGKRGETGDTVQ